MEYKSADHIKSLIYVIAFTALMMLSCHDESPVQPIDNLPVLASYGAFTSDISGNVDFEDTFLGKIVVIRVRDSETDAIVPGIRVLYFCNGRRAMVYLNDPSGVRFPQWHMDTLGLYSNEGGDSINITATIPPLPDSTETAVHLDKIESDIFFPDLRGFEKLSGQGTLEQVVSQVSTNGWLYIKIGPTVLSKLGLEPDSSVQYKELLLPNHSASWKDALNDQGLHDGVSYVYGYYSLTEDYREQYVNLSHSSQMGDYEDSESSMTVLYLLDVSTILGGRAVLRWNTGLEYYLEDGSMTDLDIHVWDEYGNHAYYMDQTGIPGANIDIDNIWGYGPETFTVEEVTSSYYIIEINFYSGYNPANPTSGEVDVAYGGIFEEFGPHLFNASDNNGVDPDAWWSVGTFNFSGGGEQLGKNVDETKTTQKTIETFEIPQELREKIQRDKMSLPRK